MGVKIQMVLNLFFGIIELGFRYSAGAVVAVLCLRLAIMMTLSTFFWGTFDKKFHKVMDPVTLALYMVSKWSV